MSKLIYSIGIFLLVLTGIVFAILNADPVQINYYFGQKQIPLSLALIVFLVLGAVLGVLASMTVILRTKRETAKFRKAADMAEKEINNLRSIPIKNQH